MENYPIKKNIIPLSLEPVEYSKDGRSTTEITSAEDCVKRRQLEIQFEGTKDELRYMLNIIKETHENFVKDCNIYHNYIHDSFLRDVKQYYWNTDYYFERILYNELNSLFLNERIKYAKKIIQYLESDKSIELTCSINNFIERWKETIEEDIKIESESVKNDE